MQVKRGKYYTLRIRPFGKGKIVTVSTTATNPPDAKRLERSILVACRSGDYSGLGPESRAVCLRMFETQGWEIPSGLSRDTHKPVEELTLWRAAQIFLNYPGVAESKGKARHVHSLIHIIEKWGKDKPIKTVWIPDIRRYQADRLADGARPGTINREQVTLSRLFSVLVELQLIEANPVRMVPTLSRKSGQRQVYLSFEHVSRIAGRVSSWLKPIVWTAFYTGMRRSEILGLSRSQVDLARRMIVLSPDDTKESDWKRIPIHHDLVPILENALSGKVQSISTDRVFLLDGHPPNKDSVKNTWRKAAEAIGLKDPRPRFHDLRHTWKTNARRSGMDPEIRERIMGHKDKAFSVSERYGFISDRELTKAMDGMTFDHGETWIRAPRKEPRNGPPKGESRAKVAQVV